MKEFNEEIAQHIIYGLESVIDEVDGEELHNNLFNTDYYIIGTHESEEKLKEYGTFEAIRLVQDYEKQEFGELYTDISNPEKLVNMLAYIVGMDILTTVNENVEFYNSKPITEELADEMTEIIKDLYL